MLANYWIVSWKEYGEDGALAPISNSQSIRNVVKIEAVLFKKTGPYVVAEPPLGVTTRVA